MTFQPAEVEYFIHQVFENSKNHIRAFPGCQQMELLRSKDHPNVLFTLSHWDSTAALEQYRHSELFRDTWAKTKVLFAEKPAAWSLDVMDAKE